MKELIINKNDLKKIQCGKINKDRYMKDKGINQDNIMDEIYQYDGSLLIILKENNEIMDD